MSNASILGYLAILGWGCALLLGIAVYVLRPERKPPVGYPRPTLTPLFDQTAVDLGIAPGRPSMFSAGVETDIVEALRVGDGRPSPRRWPVQTAHLPEIRRVK